MLAVSAWAGLLCLALLLDQRRSVTALAAHLDSPQPKDTRTMLGQTKNAGFVSKFKSTHETGKRQTSESAFMPGPLSTSSFAL